MTTSKQSQQPKSQQSKSKQPQAPAALEQSIIKATKAQVLELENNNFHHLILWRSNEKWWKMCGHSALIYAYYVGPDLLEKRDITIHIDTDRYHHSPDGTVSIHDIDNFTAKMHSVKIERSSKSTKNIVIFTLPITLPRESVENFRREEAGNRKKINEVLFSHIDNQYLESEIRKSTEAIFKKAKKLPQDRFKFVGEPLYQHAIALFSTKNRLARGDTTSKEAYQEIYFHNNELLCLIDLAYELNFFSPSEISSLIRHLHNIYVITAKELQQDD